MFEEKLRDQNIECLVPLAPPVDYLKEFPPTIKAKNQIINFRRQISSAIAGGSDRMLLVVGPCSIHDPEAGLEYAERLAGLAQKVSDRLLIIMRVYFEKPRTTLGWKGLINEPDLDGKMNIAEGLRRARRFLLNVAELGLPAGTEWLDPITPQYLSDLVSWGAIGARTVESQTHRELASGLSMPVGFKNGTGGTRHSVQIAVNGMIAARKPHVFLGTDQCGRSTEVHTKGNPDGHLILRGGEQGPNYDATSIDAASEMLKRAGFLPKVIIDCSHGNSGKDYRRQAVIFREVIERRLAGDRRIAGTMIESNLNENRQEYTGEGLKPLRYGVSITDGCIAWEQTQALVLEAPRALVKAL